MLGGEDMLKQWHLWLLLSVLAYGLIVWVIYSTFYTAPGPCQRVEPASLLYCREPIETKRWAF